MKSILFLILTVLGCYWGYANYGQNEPVETQLTNFGGNTMDILLLSRGAGQIKFQRTNDGKYFSYPIEDLSLISKCKVYWYMRESVFSDANSDTNSDSGAANRSEPVTDLYWKGMMKQMTDLIEDVRLLGYEFAATETGAQRNSVQNKLANAKLKINKLTLKMEEFKSRTK
jgi:hypothetical protein